MPALRLSLSVFVAAAIPCSVGYAQQVISAQAGTIHYIEGAVYSDGQQLHRKATQFPTLAAGQELRTEDGRAEVLLTPGSYLRLADHSAIRMVSNRLVDARVEVVRGSVLVECDELLKDNSITLVHNNQTIVLKKHGLYRLDTEPARFRVYDGVAEVQSSSGPLTLKKGKQTALDTVVAAERFKIDPKTEDDLYSWSGHRSYQLALNNRSATQSLIARGTPWSASGWWFDPTFGMFTFIPYRGIAYSPFGWEFWSPAGLGYYYIPVAPSNGGGGNGRTPPAKPQTPVSITNSIGARRPAPTETVGTWRRGGIGEANNAGAGFGWDRPAGGGYGSASAGAPMASPSMPAAPAAMSAPARSAPAGGGAGGARSR